MRLGISNYIFERKRMSTHGDGGKGSAPRPIPDPQKFRDNWDQIFGKKDKDKK